ncbi:MAG: hypothetical protein HQL90_11250 [Magnetococcales bacterium]|nr:hypothetical protein [Magnetococcales bacterium]
MLPLPPQPDPEPLPPVSAEHSGALLQLDRLLTGAAGGRFVLVLLEYGENRYQEAIIQRLEHMKHPALRLWMQPDWVSSGPILDALAALPAEPLPVHLLALGPWLRLEQGTAFCGLLNGMREMLAAQAARPLLVWLSGSELRTLALEAPDLWAWRSAVFSFSRPGAPQADMPFPPLASVDRSNLEHAAVLQRLAAINSHLDSHPEPSWAVAALWRERGELRQQVGDYDDAWADLRAARTLFEQQDDPSSAASTALSMAKLLGWRGESTTALALLRDEVLPVYQKLNDGLGHAKALDRIAALYLYNFGKPDEAWQLLTKTIPFYEQSDDSHSCAVAMGHLAHIHLLRDEPDEAFRICEAQIPLYEKAGDTFGRAAALLMMAEIWALRGELDEALRLCREQIPVIKKTGHVLGYAFAMTLMARILNRRGERDEALRICSEQMPVLEKVGEPSSLAALRDLIEQIVQAQH